MEIKGSCHCANLTFTLTWPGDAADIAVRECGCSFCRKHAGAWTSHRGAQLDARIVDGAHLSRYRFGTSTADFHVCTRCGVVPFVTSEVDGHLYAVVNTNTFSNVDISSLVRAPTDFDGEDTGSRLTRRARNWIPVVRIGAANPT